MLILRLKGLTVFSALSVHRNSAHAGTFIRHQGLGFDSREDQTHTATLHFNAFPPNSANSKIDKF